jgi:hypothetical protein
VDVKEEEKVLEKEALERGVSRKVISELLAAAVGSSRRCSSFKSTKAPPPIPPKKETNDLAALPLTTSVAS